ncbi:VRR-NUC domain-containing protein [Listeria monocytogenes]|uniref:VRR-NUC domain-containing protein n=1 Tax=Listeria monocytogenes TaxID=1639 RepID=UPI000E745610|nr:VRR-NUC domain-containing protein [Listeria monocytogenes]EAE5878528.1 VRR-NUC domain-containing protein [Listeria monocytogenes]EDP7666816.1 VRR-NUC domain-containing protein [Listeria monocytogenes]EEO3389673.1 VRR-NUC domain-containing protein [Listeria monocytogenes]EEO3692654.1 VRR-NUC domain-containing protein [Listeria monocytogenes]EEO6694483.1 VRR-NUC domain-containing protein [Listeria monocytogenes]
MIIENDIENYLIRQVKKRNGLCLKWTSPGNAGVPDRIVMNNKHIFFIELKKTGEEPSPLQKIWIKKLTKLNKLVFVIDSKNEVDAFIRDVFSK